jgi:ABC-type multidrug transport system ATPase subunit
MGGTDPLVTIDAVDRSFGDLLVLEDVSFALPPGAAVCLVGPNGSGKSTLLRIVAGLLDPSAGSVSLHAEAARPVGYLAQRPAYRPQFTVRETLTFYASLLDIDDRPGEVADSALGAAGLAPVADRRVGALSGGMVRLLGIAQATIGDPPVLVLDEPSSGLDPTMTQRVRETVDELAAGGRGILLATHDLGTVERVADRVLVLDQGGIVADGTISDILESTGADDLPAAVPLLTRSTDEVTVSPGGR